MSQDRAPTHAMIDFAERYASTSGPLVQLTYVSRRLATTDDDQLINILLSAAVRNFLAGISAKLWVSSTHIVQTLEGSAAAVESSFRRIAADNRHSSVTCIARQRVNDRVYARPLNWNRVAGETWAVVGANFGDGARGFADACEEFIRTGAAPSQNQP